MRITITDYYSSANKGDASILEGMIINLRKTFPDCRIYILSYYPDVVKALHNIDSSKPLINTHWRKGFIFEILKIPYLIIWAIFYKYKINLPGIVNKDIMEAYLESDLILSVGGGHLNDNYRPAILGRLFNLYFSKLAGKRVIIYAQSIGPFNTRRYRFLAKYIFNMLDLISLRDTRSKYILRSLNVDKPLIVETVDAAFGLDVKNPTTGEKKEKLLSEDIKLDKNKLKISISVRKWDHYSKKAHFHYINTIAKVADYLIENKNAEIFFISTCTDYGGYKNDDRLIANQIIKRMKNIAKVVTGEYSPKELIGIFSLMDLHIGTRMHSNIFAIFAGIPLLAIQYEFKTEGLMEMFDIDEYVIEIDKISFNNVIGKIEKIMDEKEEFQSMIENRIEDIKKSAKELPLLIKNKLAIRTIS